MNIDKKATYKITLFFDTGNTQSEIDGDGVESLKKHLNKHGFESNFSIQVDKSIIFLNLSKINNIFIEKID